MATHCDRLTLGWRVYAVKLCCCVVPPAYPYAVLLGRLAAGRMQKLQPAVHRKFAYETISKSKRLLERSGHATILLSLGPSLAITGAQDPCLTQGMTPTSGRDIEYNRFRRPLAVGVGYPRGSIDS